jgi:hypothetical protein
MPEDMKISKPYIDRQMAEVVEQQEQIQQISVSATTDLTPKRNSLRCAGICADAWNT